MSQADTSPKKHRFKSISIVFFLSFVGLSTLILFVEGGISLYTNLQNEQQFISSEQQKAAKEAGHVVQDYLENKFILLDVVATSADITKKTANEQQIILTKLLNRDPAFRQLVLYTPNKQKQTQVSRLSSAFTNNIDAYTDANLFSRVLKGENYTTKSYTDKNTNEPMTLIAVPVKNAFGDITHVLVAEINLKFMWELVSGLSIGKSGVAYVIDEKGTLLAFNDTSRVLKGENLKNLEEVKEFVGGNDEDEDNTSDIVKGIYGTTVVSTFFVITKEPRWAIVIEEPLFEAYQPVIEEMLRLTFVIIFSFIFSIIISILLSRRITRPIIRLRDAAQKISSSGDLSTTIEVRSHDEIGELAEAFNQMTKQLKESYGALEQKVQEKTAELAQKVEETERMNKLMVGREVKMIELKKENDTLRQELEKNKSQG